MKQVESEFRESGFTLIELLVVTAIIGIISAFAVSEFAEYRRQAWDSAHLQYFEMARKSLAGRNESVTDLPPGAYRTLYKYYNWPAYQLTNISAIEELAPGMPTVPNWIYMYIREDNCSGQSGGCFVQYIYTENCRTGIVHYFVEAIDGTAVDSSWLNPAAKGSC